jgi:hypothetical protein
MNDDAVRTLEMIRVRRARVVLLAPREKKPPAKWQITSDVDRVAQHLRRGGNLGLMCSEVDRVAAFDADDLLRWAEMIDTLGQPAAAWVETGRGRLHYYVEWEPALPAKIEWDGAKLGEIQRGGSLVAARLQQVVIPPSVHPDTGRRYRWIVDPVTQPLEPLPGEWRAYLRGLVYANHGR